MFLFGTQTWLNINVYILGWPFLYVYPVVSQQLPLKWLTKNIYDYYILHKYNNMTLSK